MCWVGPFALVFFRGTEKRLKAAKALKEKGETPEELLRSIKENEAAVAEAEREVAAWKAIVGKKSRREEAAKAEAERKAAEERERAEKEERDRIEAERKAESVGSPKMGKPPNSRKRSAHGSVIMRRADSRLMK